MKNYTIICLMIISVIMTFSGCKDNHENQSELSADMFVSESSPESETDFSDTTSPVLPETTKKITTSAVTDSEKSGSVQHNESTTAGSSETEISVPETEKNIIDNELPVIRNSETGNNTEIHEITTDSITEISDDVIELPFVPAR